MELDLDTVILNYQGEPLQAQTGVRDKEGGGQEPIFEDQTLGDMIIIGLADRPGEQLAAKEKIKVHRISMLAEEGGTIVLSAPDLTFIQERAGREMSGLSSLGYGRLCEIIGEPGAESAPKAPAARKATKRAPAKKVAKRAPAKKAAARKRR